MSNQENATNMELVAEYLRVVGAQEHPITPMYRGQANHEWQPMPSILRAGSKGISSFPTLRTFKQFVRPYISVPPQTELEWLVLAQHQGIPTGLLDWTLNPLIALFFACGEPSEKSGAVLRMYFHSIYRLDYTHDVNPFEATNGVEGLALLSGRGLNARSTAQNSVMTLHRPSPDDPSGASIHLKMTKELFRVPAEKKKNYLGALNALGFDAASLFVDLQASVAAFKALVASASTGIIVSVP